MSHLTITQARQTGISIYNLVSRSGASAITLSSGTIVAITIVGSVVLFLLIVGPILVHLAKRQGSHRAAACPVSSLSLAEHGHLVQNGNVHAPRRLRKKSVASEHAAYSGVKDTESERGGAEFTKHLSLPILPSVFSRPEIWRISGPLSGDASWDGGGGDRNGNASRNGPPSRGDSNVHGERMYGSPEKHRGYTIYQNRRKMSWIDEDALHGPRVSPKKNVKRKPSWLTGNELTRKLSRHLSFHRFGAPELARSPTLPCLETGQEREYVGRMPEEQLESLKTRNTENAHRSHESGAEIEIEPRFPVRQPLQQGGSLNSQPRPQRLPIPSAAPPNPYRHSHTAVNAAQRLAGQARVPSLDAGAKAQRHPRLQQSNTDAELQVILRRTAEKLEDGRRSARRQTLMIPTSSSSSILPDQTRQGPNQECGCGKGRARPGDMTPSPAKSQKSAPAAMTYSELEGCSPMIQQGPSQSGTPWQTHRRTHTRQISLVSQLSMLSEAGSMAATPSNRSSQAGESHTVLSTPNRIAQPSPSYPQHVLNSRPYSPASQQSSALSTVYSEDEDSPPTSVLKLGSVPEGRGEIGRATAQAWQVCDTFDGRRTWRDGEDRNDRGSQELRGIFQTVHDPQPPYIRRGTLGQILPNTAQDAVVSASTYEDGIKQPAARISPKAPSTFTLQDVEATPEDPFTTCRTPTRQKLQRLSQVFSPLPAELPGDIVSSSLHAMKPISETPTPSPSHRRVIPPPHRLRPAASSPTLGNYHDPQFQIQPPSREPSPVASESGLSSVYDSYRYSRYSDSLEGSQMLARLSNATILTVPPTEASPTETKWNEDIFPATSAKNRKDYRGLEGGEGAYRSARVSLNSAVLGAGAYTHFVGTLESSGVEDGSVQLGYTVKDTLSRSQPIRDISLSDASDLSGESAYSQDEDGRDKLGPLVPFYHATTASGKYGVGVTSTVAELRRMNSQVSCVSGYSTATTIIAGDVSPTLPALRGGGCSPGKKAADGGAKNYLSLGSSPTSKGGEDEDSYAESKRYDAGSGMDGNEKKMTPLGIMEDTVKSRSKGTNDGITVRRGDVRRSRRSTIVESYEQDLDRARHVFRESGGYNLQAISEVSKDSVGPRDLITHAAKLSQEDGRRSLMGLELYDNKGFLRSSLRSSLASQDLANYV
ncbi:hypothetical protein E0Z10_g2984 [Xylaria hypoxylon]|uniref:Uncharacterized protein n=1 Tax=Xylaria hypoxylon TaxID=37992 RepID=A0A4Z0YN69_9PEZI|nr:hypothetical protein E0Z10_g2984 [Xylaria hypoxylon]